MKTENEFCIESKTLEHNFDFTNAYTTKNKKTNEIPKLSHRLSKNFKSHKRINKKSPKYISHITIDSVFIFDFKNPDKYFHNIKDKNLIKFNKNEYLFLKQKIIDLKNLKSQANETNNENKIYIELDSFQINQINNFFNIKPKENDVIKFVRNKLNQNIQIEKLSCRKLARMYLNETGKTISKTYINNILKNKLNLSYLKTCIKTTKVNSDVGIFSSFLFIKSIVKCLKLGFKILFLDESSIMSQNNNYRTWRSSTDNIYFNMGTRTKKNLILVVSDNEVIYFKITDENTNEKNFLSFMKELEEIISKSIKDKYVIVMDNLSCHRTKNLLNYYKDRKINVIFNSPYMSNFNAVEFAFGAIKIKLYNNLYESMEATIKDVENILKDENIKFTLLHNFIETLGNYLDFYEINKEKNLNNLEL